ncbi:uncharacterized protein LOC116847236 [Odontomachus brunneus]|uniref:uncharacterized protein LOC116847236 n=1 Tax=Odontomachus brunneus TaxID=486640 RepID=UPI0013F1FC86|nr:uncharacterized protein LOC116847236 [Odontomachus brunneus]
MHLRQAALNLMIAAIMCKISWASMQCKTIVMDIHMKKCRLGARAKRDVERLDLLKHDEKLKRKEGPDYFSKMNNDPMYFHGVPQKRQLTYSPQVDDIAVPIVMDALNRAAQAYFSFNAGYYNRALSSTGHSLGWSDYPSITTRPLVASSLYTAFSDDFDLDLNSEELEELYDNIYKRVPRASKDEAWRIFLETASKCCQNVDKCLKETVHIPCLVL